MTTIRKVLFCKEFCPKMWEDEVTTVRRWAPIGINTAYKLIIMIMSLKLFQTLKVANRAVFNVA